MNGKNLMPEETSRKKNIIRNKIKKKAKQNQTNVKQMKLTKMKLKSFHLVGKKTVLPTTFQLHNHVWRKYIRQINA